MNIIYENERLTAMDFVDIMLLAVALSADAFAVAVCKGLAMKKVTVANASFVGVWFGGFQMLMPVIGFFLASIFERQIMRFDHWIALALLVAIGINMIREAFSKDDECVGDSLAFGVMIVLAVATSIDALASGITFVGMSVRKALAASALIGITAFAFSAVGVRIGNVFGLRYKSRAEIAGGVVLILLGIKIFSEHMGWISF